MDRGYWNTEMIEYLSNNGFQLLGTHKRTQKFPFTYGEVKAVASKKEIVTVGAKSVYWAKSKIGAFDVHAAAYRNGKGNVALMFSTIKDMPLYSFKYKAKDSNTHCVSSIALEIGTRVKKLTTGQGGVDWHYMRATSGAITSTTASFILRRCQADITVACKDFLAYIGISVAPQLNESGYDEGELNSKNVSQLKEMLRNMNLSVGGNKSDLVSRILTGVPVQLDIRQDLRLGL